MPILRTPHKLLEDFLRFGRLLDLRKMLGALQVASGRGIYRSRIQRENPLAIGDRLLELTLPFFQSR